MAGVSKLCNTGSTCARLVRVLCASLKRCQPHMRRDNTPRLTLAIDLRMHCGAAAKPTIASGSIPFRPAQIVRQVRPVFADRSTLRAGRAGRYRRDGTQKFPACFGVIRQHFLLKWHLLRCFTRSQRTRYAIRGMAPIRRTRASPEGGVAAERSRISMATNPSGAHRRAQRKHNADRRINTRDIPCKQGAAAKAPPA
jgi:hypothetical protein